VAVNLGDPTSPFGDIHPRYKQQMAARLALSADAVVGVEINPITFKNSH
jgi:hypothetical protein